MLRTSKEFRFSLLINFLDSFLLLASIFFLPIFLRDHVGFFGHEIGFFVGVASVSAILFIFPVGLSADKFSPRNVVRFFSLLAAGSYWLISFLPQNVWLFWLFFIGWGMSRDSLRTGLEAELLKGVSKKEADRLFGFYKLVGTIGAFIGIVVGGFLIDNFGFQYVFWMQTVGYLLIFCLAGFLTKRSTVEIELIHHLKDFSRPEVIFFVLIFFLFASHHGAEHVAYALFLEDTFALSGGEMGLFMGSAMVVLGSLACISGHLLHRRLVTLQQLFLWGMVLSGATHVLMVFGDLWFSYAMRILHECGDGMLSIVIMLGIKEMFHVDRIGGSSSLVKLAMMLGTFMSAFAFGALLESKGASWPLAISGVIMLVLAVVIWIGFGRRRLGSR